MDSQYFHLPPSSMKEKSPVVRGLLNCVRLQQLLAPLAAMVAALDVVLKAGAAAAAARGRLGCGMVNISRPDGDAVLVPLMLVAAVVPEEEEEEEEEAEAATTAALTALCHFPALNDALVFAGKRNELTSIRRRDTWETLDMSLESPTHTNMWSFGTNIHSHEPLLLFPVLSGIAADLGRWSICCLVDDDEVGAATAVAFDEDVEVGIV